MVKMMFAQTIVRFSPMVGRLSRFRYIYLLTTEEKCPEQDHGKSWHA